MFASREENEKHFNDKRLKVNKQFINEVKERESRKKTPKHLVESFLEEAKKQISDKKTD